MPAGPTAGLDATRSSHHMTGRRRTPLGRLAAAVLASVLWMSQAMSNTVDDAFRDGFSALPPDKKRSALAAAVAHDGGQPLVLVSGNRHKNSKEPVGLEAPWHIGSITKPFTATLVMRLVDQGVLTLDTPLGTLLASHSGDMHPEWRAVTMRQALSHTAGLPANVPFLDLFKADGEDAVADRLARLQPLWRKPLAGRPGAYAYSNIGYVLAGAVVDAATGRSWEDLIEAEIAGPLALTSLGFGPPNHPQGAWGHRSMFGFLTADDPANGGVDNPPWMAPAGGLHMNLADLAGWGQAHLAACRSGRPDLLSDTSCQAMRTPVAADYGLGWSITPVPDHDVTLIWHNGSNSLWYAILGMVPEKDLVVAVALNRFDQKRGDAALRSLLLAVLEVL